MKRIIPIVLTVFLLLLSCSKDEEPKVSKVQVTYYFNHWASVNFNATIKCTYTGEEGEDVTFNLSGSKMIKVSVPKGITVKLTMEAPKDGGNDARIDLGVNTVASFTNSKQKETLTWKL